MLGVSILAVIAYFAVQEPVARTVALDRDWPWQMVELQAGQYVKWAFSDDGSGGPLLCTTAGGLDQYAAAEADPDEPSDSVATKKSAIVASQACEYFKPGAFYSVVSNAHDLVQLRRTDRSGNLLMYRKPSSLGERPKQETSGERTDGQRVAESDAVPASAVPQQNHPISECRKVPDKSDCVKASWTEFKSAILSEYANWKAMENTALSGDVALINRALANAIRNGWYVHNHWAPIAPEPDELAVIPRDDAEAVHWCRVAIIDMKFWLVGLTSDYADNQSNEDRYRDSSRKCDVGRKRIK